MQLFLADENRDQSERGEGAGENRHHDPAAKLGIRFRKAQHVHRGISFAKQLCTG
jgi:hypothetical protein